LGKSHKLPNPQGEDHHPLPPHPYPHPHSHYVVDDEQRMVEIVVLKMYYRKCTAPVVASNGKYGLCPQGTWFQLLNQPITLYLGQNLLKLVFTK